MVEEPLFLSSAIVGMLTGLEGTDPIARRSYQPVADKENDTPRLVCEGDGCNVIVDFLEWIFRHFYHDDWLMWATDVCEAEFDEKFGKEKNPLDRIFRAFKESKITVLRQYPNEISEIK